MSFFYEKTILYAMCGTIYCIFPIFHQRACNVNMRMCEYVDKFMYDNLQGTVDASGGKKFRISDVSFFQSY